MNALQTLIRKIIPPASPFSTPVELFRAKVGETTYGPVRVHEFKRIPGFTLQTPVAPFGTENWQPAYKAIDLQKYFHYGVENSFSQIDYNKAIREHNTVPLATRVRQWQYNVQRWVSRIKKIILWTTVTAILTVALAYRLGTTDQKASMERIGSSMKESMRKTAVRLIDQTLVRLQPK